MSSDLEARSFIRRGNYLTPADAWAEDLFQGIKEGAEVLVSIRKPRNPKHHRKLFALLKIVCDNSTRYNEPDVLLEDLKVVTGHYRETFNYLTGQVYPEPLSISYASMSQTRFDEWYKLAVQACSEHLGTDIESLAEEVWGATERNDDYAP